MDDMYQYAASAVNKEQKPTSVAEEDDVILKAFNNMGWGKKWSSLVDTVKKQSEAFVEGTKKDLQEFAQVLTEDEDPSSSSSSDSRTIINEDGSATTSSRSRNVNEEEHDVVLDTIRENLAKINTVNFASLRDGLTHTLNQTLPSQITSVRLPENMDLAHLKEGLANGTRSAEHYLEKFGTDVISALKSTVTVLGPEEKEAQQERDVKNEKSPRIFASRKEALIAKMQTNENTFLKEPELSKTDQEQEHKILETFNSGFNIEEYTDEIAQLLNDFPHLRDMMDKLVPIQVTYKLFWQRYFYHAWKIDQDEQKRQLIVKGVEEQGEDDEADFKWDSDEEESTPQLATSSSTATITTKKALNKQTEEEEQGRPSTSNSDDTDDFSNISEPIESPPLKSSSTTTEDEWVKTDDKNTSKPEEKEEEEDSDSDWE